jgi:hypothetical protein
VPITARDDGDIILHDSTPHWLQAETGLHIDMSITMPLCPTLGMARLKHAANRFRGRTDRSVSCPRTGEQKAIA